MGIGPTTKTTHLQPAAVLFGYGDDTRLFYALVPFSGHQIHIDEKGRICVHIVKNED